MIVSLAVDVLLRQRVFSSINKIITKLNVFFNTIDHSIFR
jgi:hypothetical protein